MFELKIPVTEAFLMHREYGTDIITFTADARHGAQVHGEKIEIFGSAYYRLEVAADRGEETLKALGVPEDIIFTVRT